MSVNPPLVRDQFSQSLFPQPHPGEVYILRREEILFKVKIPLPGRGSEVVVVNPGGGQSAIQRESPGFFSSLFSGSAKESDFYVLSGKGEFFLSTKRIVFVSKSGSNRADFSSFEIPLERLVVTAEEKPTFEQPVFGANYLQGLVRGAGGGGGVPETSLAKWKLTFLSGGCGTFLPVFFRVLEDILRSQNHQPNPQFVSAVASGNLQNVAFIDPNDPSVVFVSQPSPLPGSQVSQPAVMVMDPSAAPPPCGSHPSAPPPEQRVQGHVIGQGARPGDAAY